MRTVFIECKSRNTAVRRAPWASKVIKVTGGYLAFESVDDYRNWRNQK
jgi:hypothetical protein